ncbi:MAG: NADPH-dependent 7-cyano-7-deazaguanine reductase QueF [Pantoea sp. Brub]|nr:NADPH-dependent 7-cyano-7-deazaguanine reductase QueF [Pantoea sp. Brub]
MFLIKTILYEENKILNNSLIIKTTDYNDTYNRSLLNKIPRYASRQNIGLISTDLPFFGNDIWTLYELSWLNSKGLPQVCIGRIIINANSINLIELKSFKLYLNSFNQTKFETWMIVRQVLERDISHLVEGEVHVALFRLHEIEWQPLSCFNGYCIDEQDIEIYDYFVNANMLSNINNNIVKETLVSNLLKINCPISNQPNWSSIMISYKGIKINHISLLRYLISFRKYQFFSEQCVEKIFNDILYLCHPDELTVYVRYTRRGGIDINPWRSNIDFYPNYSRLVRQ